MKKSILIIGTVLATFSLMALGYLNINRPVSGLCEKPCFSEASDNLNLAKLNENMTALNLVYKVESRYFATINIEDLHRAEKVADVLPKEADWSKHPIQSLIVTLFDGDQETVVYGDGLIFSEAQRRLLQSTEISDNFRLIAHCKGKTNTSCNSNYDLAYWMTATPYSTAEYIDGQEALITHLKENSKAEVGKIRQYDVKPGRVNFTITSNGTISNVALDSSSGYPSFDNVMLELVSDMSDKWTPASNSKGEKFDQELVVFFGSEGC